LNIAFMLVPPVALLAPLFTLMVLNGEMRSSGIGSDIASCGGVNLLIWCEHNDCACSG
jgi:hypothetical protein